MTAFVVCPTSLLVISTIYWHWMSKEAAHEAAHDAHAGEWRKVERGNRARWVDPCPQYRREALAQRLTLDTDASSMYIHTELFRDLLKFQFASPGDYGLDVLWDGTPLQWQYADLHAGESRRSPLLYELEALDHNATNFWQQENRMVGEVNYVQLFQWIKDQTALWQDDISTVYVYVDNRPLADPNQCPNFLGQVLPVATCEMQLSGTFSRTHHCHPCPN